MYLCTSTTNDLIISNKEREYQQNKTYQLYWKLPVQDKVKCCMRLTYFDNGGVLPGRMEHGRPTRYCKISKVVLSKYFTEVIVFQPGIRHQVHQDRLGERGYAPNREKKMKFE